VSSTKFRKPLIEPGTPGERLRALIKKKGLTQTRFAEILGVKQGVVSGWLSDRHSPSSGTRKVISGVLGVTTEWVTTGISKGTVADKPAPYGPPRRQRQSQRMFDEMMNSNDREILSHLDRQMRLLYELWDRRKKEREKE
jgi:transcriptional regulator with XRE-family HTH domain